MFARNLAGVKSVQLLSGGQAVTSGSGMADKTIAAVVMANTIIMSLGGNCDDAAASTGAIAAALTSTTNVRLYWNSNASRTYNYVFAIVEFYPGVLRSAPQFVAATATNVTISALKDYTKAVVFYCGGTAGVLCAYGVLTSPTNLNWGVCSGVGSQRMCIAEFNN
jgi:hypothetical protein